MCLVSAAVFGFFLLGLGPLGFQYGAELTYPAPEAASNGLLLMVGQILALATRLTEPKRLTTIPGQKPTISA